MPPRASCSVVAAWETRCQKTTQPEVWFPRQHFLANFLSAPSRSAFVYSEFLLQQIAFNSDTYNLICSTLVPAQMVYMQEVVCRQHTHTYTHTRTHAQVDTLRSWHEKVRLAPRKGQEWFWAVSSASFASFLLYGFNSGNSTWWSCRTAKSLCWVARPNFLLVSFRLWPSLCHFELNDLI